MIDRSKLSTRIPAVLLVLALVYVGVLGGMSTNVGQHWDEINITNSVQNSLRTGLLLPRWYNYPSVTYDVSVLTALEYVQANAATLDSTRLMSYLGGTGYTLHLRTVFFLLCTLSGLAVYLLARRLSGNGWIALFAALTLVGSWEFFYQAKWVAPDCLLLLFASSSLWSQHRLMEPGKSRRQTLWSTVASIFAGLCMGTKYPGGMVLVPLMFAVAMAPRDRAHGRFAGLRQAGGCLLIATLTFLLVSPGCVLEPWMCLSNLVHEMEHYGMGHGGHTVSPGWDHFSRLAIYLGVVFLSGHVVPAAAAAVLVLVGVTSLFRSRARAAVWLLSLPVLYVAYMCTQSVMIVRNYLLLLPPFAVLAGLGLSAVARAAGSRSALRYLVTGAAVALVVFNLGFATRSALSIISPNTATQRSALEKHLASSPRTRFFLSPACRALLDAAPAYRPANVDTSIRSADRVIFITDEIRQWEEFPANRPWRYRTVWSRMEDVNWDYYPTWIGNPRMMDVSASDREAIAR